MNKPETKAQTKATYMTPSLEVFGSVRNLTGGSTGLSNDGRSSRRA